MTTDKLVTLSNRLKEVKEKFEALEATGIDKDLLIVWIKDKTKLSKGSIIQMLKAQEDFYNRLVRNAMIDKLEGRGK